MTLKIKEMNFFGSRLHVSNNQIGLYPFFISAEFRTGINFLTGGLHECGAGLSYVLCKGQLSSGKYCVDKVGKNGHCTEICLDDKIITLKQLQQITYYIAGEDKRKRFFKGHHGKTVIKHLQIAEKKRRIDINEIINTFDLDDRVYRKISSLSGNRYRYSTAIGIAYGKKILCYPWFSYDELHCVEFLFSVLSKMAKENNLIIIVPVENVDLFKDKFSYNEIVMRNLNLIYANGGILYASEINNYTISE
ncbi:MAG: hypothetical protein FWD71_22585 [Oscillospiraceae bacterium]|nr:hypothetical protein [Oscillospiraceae bacterium]